MVPAQPLGPERAEEIRKTLMEQLLASASRKDFFAELSRQLQNCFHFDRLCINLYDSQVEMLTYFTHAEGTVVNTLSPVRPAEESTTVAGHVISTRRPVIITDFNQFFAESTIHPIAEVGLQATMAFPLFLGNNIIATLHCSFGEIPGNIYELAAFMLEISQFLGIYLGAILGLEQQGSYVTPEASIYRLPEESIICHSPAMREVMRQIDVVARLDIPVLILGETGTGKSMLSHYIHRNSSRKDAQFIKVNCPALSPTLFESELFGHAKGAFTGASAKRTGRFEMAHGGTLFLDEIGELSMEMQSKLLQVLDDSRFERVGESISIAVDTRIVAATNVDVRTAIARGTLRQDLYHRLSLCLIELPPLRKRIEDIPPLCAALASQLAKKMQIPPITFTPDLMRPLLQHSWRGNVRELRNVINRIMLQNVMHKKINEETVRSILGTSVLHRQTGAAVDEEAAAYAAPAKDGAWKEAAHNHASGPERMLTLEEMERQHIEKALMQCNGVVSGPSGAAGVLDIPRSTLLHRMKKLGLRT